MKLVKEGQRISLFYINETMINDIWQNSLDKNNRKYVPDEVFETLEETSSVVKQIIHNYQTNESPLVFAVFTNEAKQNIGYVQLVKISEGYEIGYHIYEKFTNQGYATEALGLFLDYLKENTHLDMIYGIALAINRASRRVLEKNGFTLIYEGVGPYQGKKRKIIKMIKAVK